MNMQDQMTYSDFISLYIDKLADQWRDWRKRREIIACDRGMEVCQTIIDNELINKSAYQKRQMMLIKELADRRK